MSKVYFYLFAFQNDCESAAKFKVQFIDYTKKELYVFRTVLYNKAKL